MVCLLVIALNCIHNEMGRIGSLLCNVLCTVYYVPIQFGVFLYLSFLCFRSLVHSFITVSTLVVLIFMGNCQDMVIWYRSIYDGLRFDLHTP